MKCTILYYAVGEDMAIFTVTVSSAMQLIRSGASMFACKLMSACMCYVCMNVCVDIYIHTHIRIRPHVFMYVCM